MEFSTVAPLGGRALLAAIAVAGCAVDVDESPEGMDAMLPGTSDDDVEPDDAETAPTDDAETDPTDDAETDPDEQVTNPCALGAPGVYSPFAAPGAYPSGPVDALPWFGIAPTGALNAYPAGDEDFRGYGQGLPKLVECSNDKDRRSHLDVTAGCLDAVDIGSSHYTRGLVRTNDDDYFRALALGYAPGASDHPIKWTDQSVEYRFYHHGRTGNAGKPGFKAFARYRSENDLYVASWRFDGVVLIQRKLCGDYTALAEIDDFGPPSSGVWHSLRFEAVDDDLRLYLDDDLVLTATSSSLSWGTAGIRVDSADGTYIDDWTVYQP